MILAVDCRMLGMSGIGVFLENFLENLSESISYLLIGEEQNLIKYKSQNVRILNCHISIFSFHELFLFPVSEINKCDAFFSPNYNLPFRIKVPIYSTIHDVVFLDCKGLTSIFGKFIRYLYLWCAVKRSLRIFTVSQFSKSRISYFFNVTEKIVVVYAAVGKKIRQTLECEKVKGKDFIFIGNIKKHKGIHTLLEAFSKIQDVVTDNLMVIGSNEGFKTSLELTNIKNARVTFMGKLSDEEVIKLIRNSKALIQPSIYEGFGLPPLEALYLNTPVILSDIPVFKELYSDYPVVFFAVNNSDDLADKMLNINSFNLYNKIDFINNKFDVKQVAGLITSTIKSNFI